MGGDGVGPVVQQLNQFSHHGAACTEVMEGGIRPILSLFAGSHFQVASLTQTIRLISNAILCIAGRGDEVIPCTV